MIGGMAAISPGVGDSYDHLRVNVITTATTSPLLVGHHMNGNGHSIDDDGDDDDPVTDNARRLREWRTSELLRLSRQKRELSAALARVLAHTSLPASTVISHSAPVLPSSPSIPRGTEQLQQRYMSHVAGLNRRISELQAKLLLDAPASPRAGTLELASANALMDQVIAADLNQQHRPSSAIKLDPPMPYPNLTPTGVTPSSTSRTATTSVVEVIDTDDRSRRRRRRDDEQHEELPFGDDEEANEEAESEAMTPHSSSTLSSSNLVVGHHQRYIPSSSKVEQLHQIAVAASAMTPSPAFHDNDGESEPPRPHTQSRSQRIAAVPTSQSISSGPSSLTIATLTEQCKF
jgi:hypothetical protein